jgi:hypothetical protein
MEKVFGPFSGQGKDQSKDWHPFDQVRTRAQIGGADGVFGAGFGFGDDNGYGNFSVA